MIAYIAAMILYGALVLCAGLAGLLVYRYDMCEREPWYMLVLTALIGAAAMRLAGHLEDWTLELFGSAPRPVVVIAAVAATHEELLRLLIVVGLVVFVPRQLNDPMDGIIYGSMAGLGMAVTESIFYLDLWHSTGPLPPASEPVRLFSHLVLGGITGFAVGMARMRMPGWPRVLLGCLAVSITIHFLWDWIALAANSAGRMRWWQTAAGVALMVGGILFYGRLVVVGSDWSRRVFAPHQMRTLWGWPFTLLQRQKKESGVRSQESAEP